MQRRPLRLPKLLIQRLSALGVQTQKLGCRWFSILALMSLVLGFSSAAHSDTIRIAGDSDYPPYEYLDKNGQPAGYNVDLTKEIAAIMGLDVTIELGSWSSVLSRLESGEVDVLMGMVSSEERQKKFSFSASHAIITYSFFARRGDPVPNSFQDMEGKSVTLQNKGIMHDYLLSQDIGVDIVGVPAHSDALRLLAAGSYDYALGANLPSLYFSRENNLSNIKSVWRPVQAQPYSFAVKKGNEELLAQFSEGLAILINNGRQQEIYDRWLGTLEENDNPDYWRNLIIVASVLWAATFIGLGMVVIWNNTLRREVAKQTAEVAAKQQQLIQADKMSSLGILVSGVAHEINNPSGLILLNLPMLKDAWDDILPLLEQYEKDHGNVQIAGLSSQRMREEIPYLLTEMNDGALRIKRIVNDLRDFARQESEEVYSDIDLNQVVQTSVRLLDKTIKANTQHFELELLAGLPKVRGNEQRIEQVVINLIINACQALPNDTCSVRVNTRVDHPRNQVCLEVADEGVGIKPDAMAKLTDPFFTTKRETGGTGLGLSVSAGIMKTYGGVLRFKSEPNRGTSVTAAFPWYPDNQ